MVEHQREGYLAPQRDSAELAKGIYWINHGTTPVEQLREAARQKALKHYANPVVASQYLELYQNMLTAQAEQQKY